MRILLASSEVHPYSKTGGLADMVGALSKTFARGGHTVGLVTPLYPGIREKYPLKHEEMTLDLPLGTKHIQGDVWTLEPRENLTIYFIGQSGFFERPELYHEHGVDYPDNAERFIFFSKAAAQLARQLPWEPDVVHAHDWQAGFAPLFVQHQNGAGWRGRAPRTCMTIHNVAYQGLCPRPAYALTNLPWDYFTPNGVEFHGKLSCLKAGIVYGDVLTTVSPRYAREIMTEELGFGLGGLMQHRQASLVGILNGVDYEEWNTEANPFLAAPYSKENLSGKTTNKLALQKELGLPVDASVPLFGSIGRLVQQKGVDIMLAALEEMLAANMQFVLLGSGEPQFEKAFQDLARRFSSRVAVRIGFEEPLSHRIEAGCDFFLMPSRFEPCGLNQMYSLRYGTIPIVRVTGGLDDTVVDVREDAEKANGIKFSDYSAAALAKGMRKGLALFGEPEILQRFRLNAMASDFSWDRTATRYLEVYCSQAALA